MKTWKITVKGIVQRVGYRSFVERTARKLRLKGYIKNLDDPDESVEILIQCQNEKTVADFLHKINIKSELIDVQQIIKQETDEKEFAKFEVKRGSYEEENAERLDVAAYHLDNLTVEVRSGFKELGETQAASFKELSATQAASFKELGETQAAGFKELSSKQTDTVRAIESMHRDMTGRFDKLDDKYGKVSALLERISVALEAMAGIKK